MADVMRWKFFETKPVQCPVQATEAVEIGDLIYMEYADGLARPASTIADRASLGANQHYFAYRFLGVAMQRHRASHDPADLPLIRVATQGVFRYPVAALAAALTLGIPFGVDENAAGTALLDQQVEQVPLTSMERAIGLLNKPARAGDTEIELRLCTRIMTCAEIEQDDHQDSSSSSGV